MLSQARPSLSEQEFLQFQQLIELRLGIFLNPSKLAMLRNRLSVRLRERGIASFSAYYRLITSDHESHELDLAMELVTTNETYFFREPSHFDDLKKMALGRRPADGVFRVWCAASSTGEEPYSIAMVLADSCGSDWEVLASDINASVVEHAKRAIYDDVRTSGIPEDYRRRYCRRGLEEFEGCLRIVADLRRRVQYTLINLNESIPAMEPFDVVFLRNVMIYFKPAKKSEVLSKVARQLKPDGTLFVSHSESLHGLTDELVSLRPSVYALRRR